MSAVTYTAEELAELAGVSSWSIYNSVRDGTCPFPFVRVGRRVVFPMGPCDRILGVDTESERPDAGDDEPVRLRRVTTT